MVEYHCTIGLYRSLFYFILYLFITRIHLLLTIDFSTNSSTKTNPPAFSLYYTKSIGNQLQKLRGPQNKSIIAVDFMHFKGWLVKSNFRRKFYQI